MLEITKEEFKLQHKKYYSSIAMVGKLFIISLVTHALGLLLFNRVFTGWMLIGIWCLLLAYDIFFIIYASYCNRRYIPIERKMPHIKKLTEQLKYDIRTDAVLQVFTDAFSKTNQYDEKIYIASLLANIYEIRGQFNDAIAVMQSIEHSQFEKYPEAAVSYFEEYMDIYAELKDWNSVIAIYRDAEPYFRRYYNQNYIYCISVIQSLIYLNWAYGYYEKALEYQLMRMEMSENLAKDTKKEQNMTILNQYVKGQHYYRAALCYYYCKDYENAAKYLNMGGPLLTITPYLTNQVNQLSAEIKKNLDAANAETQNQVNI